MTQLSYADNPGAFKHKAVLVEHEGRSAWIDVAISGLVKKIWEAGIVTEMSCEETSPGVAFIRFQTGWDTERFCRALLGIQVDLSIFESLDRGEKDASFNNYERGSWPFDIPVWSEGKTGIMFPVAYIEKFTEAVSTPDLTKQGPKTIFVTPTKTPQYWR